MECIGELYMCPVLDVSKMQLIAIVFHLSNQAPTYLVGLNALNWSGLSVVNE